MILQRSRGGRSCERCIWTKEQWKSAPDLIRFSFTFDGWRPPSVPVGTHGGTVWEKSTLEDPMWIFGQQSAWKPQVLPSIQVSLWVGGMYCSIVADVYPLMATVFRRSVASFTNSVCPDTKQKWFRSSLISKTKSLMLTWPPNSTDLKPIQHHWDVLDKKSPIHERTVSPINF